MTQLHLPVEEFTTPNPVTATEDTSIEELKRLMTENGIRHIPILKGQQVVGIVSDRDLRIVLGLALREKSSVCARDIMAKDPHSVSSEEALDQVAFEMSSRKIGSVIVNEGDNFYGIFTATDALNALIEIVRSKREGNA